LQKAIKSGAWVLPGGRSEVNETSGEALIREMKEELGVEISIKAFMGNFHIINERQIIE
jgi:8-oxo-dGTP pyrophosphatase MutT (NUDIX family)